MPSSNIHSLSAGVPSFSCFLPRFGDGFEDVIIEKRGALPLLDVRGLTSLAARLAYAYAFRPSRARAFGLSQSFVTTFWKVSLQNSY